MKILEIETRSKEELIDITHLIAREVQSMGLKEGGVIVFVPHTTAGLTLNENADPSVKRDILLALRHMVPENLPYSHSEGNSPAHVKASLCGSSLYLIVKEGKLWLGTWQGITFCEFDGPRRRRLFLSAIK
ncbi:MAG: secondary thiamine-phosphate synthase enzyme YjbQ [Candidatus Aminicenantes bacterium]|nr:secondary thiamine-phosphate synthase enzyme YjbQ [Candidatus Aminicenantes bacterium]